MNNCQASTHILEKDFLQTVPHGSGVYLMNGKGGNVLYVGKARDLRKRLASYRRSLDKMHTKTGVMLSKVKSIDTILTATEKEALILEATLIKKHKPRYNVMLRDDKSYPYIKLTVQDKWPRLIVTRRKINDKARYFGPFSSASAMWQTIKILNRLFPLRRCKGYELKKRERACLNYQMHKCLAPCAGKINEQDYGLIVRDVLLALSNPHALLHSLKSKMKNVAANQQYEQAAIYRDKIKAFEKTTEKQVISATHHKNQDAFGFVRIDGAVAVSVLQIRDGLLNSHLSYFLPDPLDDDLHVLSEVLTQFYGEDRYRPNEILLPFYPADKEVFVEWLTESSGHAIVLKRPERGISAKIVQMAENNARQVFADREKKEKSWQSLAAKIMETLKLPSEPLRICCMDISNIGGEQTVGAAISFYRGDKDSKHYRHYKIKNVDGPDDYASMSELLSRHLARSLKGNFLPDLLLMDGGKGQLNIAVAALKQLGLGDKIELAGIAKEKNEEGEKIYRPGRKNPIILKRHSPVLLYMMRIRDEAHRYGITFHRRWRNKQSLSSPLDSITGVGPARKKALLKAFGSLKQLKKATVNEIATVPGIGSELAQFIFKSLSSC